MKLLILTQTIDQDDPNLGFFHRWVEEFATHVESIEVLCLKEGTHHLPGNTHVSSLGKERRAGRVSYILNFYRRVWTLRKKYDAVFVHMNSEYLILGGLLWKLLGKRTLLWHTHKSMRPIHRIAEKIVDIVGTASPESYRLKSEKVRVLGHGIDTDAFAPGGVLHTGPFRLLSTGRIARVKGLDTLLSATARLIGSGETIEVIVVGSPLTADDERYQEELLQKTRDLGLSDVVHFVGAIAHRGIVPYLQQADVFVNCSNTGSLDKAVLEAMATGLPVLTSNEGIRSALGHYGERLMFGEGDVAGLAQKVLELKGLSPEERRRLSLGLRALVTEHHGLSSLIGKIVGLLE